MLYQSVKQFSTKKVLQASPDKELSAAIAIMNSDKVSSIIICENHKPVGIVTTRDIPGILLRNRDALHRPISESMTQPLITIDAGYSLMEALDIMTSKGIRHIPIVDKKGKLEALITETDIMDAVGTTDLMRNQSTADIMITDVVTIMPDTQLLAAIETIADKRIGSLVVVDKKYRPLGVITERDIPELLGKEIPLTTPLLDIMHPVQLTSPDTIAHEALQQMLSTKSIYLGVVDKKERLCGLLSRSCFFQNITRYLIRELVESNRKLKKALGNIEKDLTQKEMLEIEKFYLAMVHSSPNGILLIHNNNITFANRTALELFGAEKDRELLGKNLLDMVKNKGDTSGLVGLLSEPGKHLSSDLQKIELKTLGQKRFTAKITRTTIPLGQTIMLTFQDITASIKAEERLRKLSQAIEQAAEAILITNRDGEIEYINPAFTRLTGYTVEEAIGMNPRILKSGKQPTGYYEKLWETILSGGIWQGKLIERRKDGTFYPATQTISPIRDEEGNITHFVGIHTDLTEKHRLEEQFYHAQKMEALGTLVSGIAHDFNNMLAIMTGNLFIAKMEIPEQFTLAHEKIDTVEEVAFTASDLITHLLAFSRKTTIDRQPIAIGPFLKETIKILRSSIPNNIEIRSHIEETQLLLEADPVQLQQIIMNLTNNARDALEETASPAIHFGLTHYQPDESFLQLHPEIASAPMACLTVADNGMGISAANRQHIFTPFFSTKGPDKGSGLGLAMVYGAVQSHGGVIDVFSKEGEGTEFRIYLPLIEEQSTTLPENLTEIYAKEAETGIGKTVLFVDDESALRTTAPRILESFGYEVLVAQNGKEAVSIYEERMHDIDIVVMDIVMPVMGGKEAAAAMLKLNPKARILFASGFDPDEGHRGQPDTIAKIPLIRKPFQASRLQAAIRKVLAG